MTPLLASLGGLALNWLESRAAEKKTYARARAKRAMLAAETEAGWAEWMAAASVSGWKDEAWTLCFIAIILACFIPPLQPFVRQGFAMLEDTPDWFQWAVLASIGASFGLRGFDRFRRPPSK